MLYFNKDLTVMEDIEENCLKVHFRYLRLHKLLPKDMSKRITIKDFIYANFYYPIVVYLFLTCVHFYKKYADPLTDLSIDVLTILVLIYDMYVFIIYFLKLNDITSFLGDLICFTKFGKPDDLEALTTKQNRNMRVLYVYSFFSIIAYAFYSYFSNELCRKKALEEGIPSSCSLMLPLWLPYDLLSDFRVRIVVFVVQTLFVLCWFLPSIVATYCIASIIELMTVRVVHLKSVLKEIVTAVSVEEKKKKLIHCVKYHIDIVRLVNRCHFAFGTLNSAHFFLSSVVLGLLYYRILKMFLIKDIVQVNGWLFCISVLCYTGQQLINESEALANDIYSLNWPDMDKGSKQCIRLMILRMQMPLKVQAGFFYSYSNEFLLMIIQASYTYVTVLSSLFSKN